MVDLVDPTQIEFIVGIDRHPTTHYGRAVTRNAIVNGIERNAGTFYILHSQECVDTTPDLRECRFSKALAWGGVYKEHWEGYEDRPVAIGINPLHRIVPVRTHPDGIIDEDDND